MVTRETFNSKVMTGIGLVQIKSVVTKTKGTETKVTQSA